ncbi:perlucin-like protein [Argopecten irradians]|uniref:perlucin-like protein n=1 Tax=Argopecten irradians TaxID=31199 RepID=UPI003718443A
MKTFFVLFVFFVINEGVSGDCRDGWERFGTNCYLLSQDVASWGEASAFCNALHSHLAMVSSATEFNFLKSTIVHRGGSYNYWIDGTDEEVEGVWRWATNDQKITYFILGSWATSRSTTQ